MRKLTKQEYQHVKEWISKHKDCDEIVFDTINRLPLKAIYHCPLGSFEKEKRVEVVQIVRKMDKLISKMEAI